ncbi:YaiO family outer membrane beta-barrel protein [Citrobacter sp. S-77]|uniref:YaiO family outer membrane beta-barrel protein n=1 Tax=Citrobacter sp. S-77 TaxID=1080067 RepID=UPI0005ED4B26|nr:YaiO family outer membrane beta-barrel protein [Citrobacter sp. S-77]
MKIKALLISIIFINLPAYANLTSLTAGYNFTNYSKEHGKLNLTYTEIIAKDEGTTFLLNLSQGHRDYKDKNFDATRGQGAFWYKWNNWLTTRTGLAFADNTPVFARQDFRQDFNLNLLSKTLFTTGYRYSKYYDDVELNALQGGVSLYVGSIIASYRYTYYDSSDVGGSYSNTLSLRLNSSHSGSYTQLWLSRGTGAYMYDWSSETLYGSVKSISVQRIQPITEKIHLGLTVGKSWYHTPTFNYNRLLLASHFTWKF